jgi:3-oxoacyl-[acyl-carrier protein] reductase
VDFTGKIVLITGASRGIGRECAKQFAERGARVAVHYNRNRQAAETTLASLAGDGHIIVQADMGDPSAVKNMVDTVAGQMGGLDILVNNAAVYEEHPITEVDYEAWQKTWQWILGANLIGPANACHCAVQHMIKRGGGRIVNVSSRGAFRGEPDAPAYGASKGGLNSMSQSLARALAPHNIFVGVVAPGWVETEMAAPWLNTPEGDAIRNQSPLGRVARAEEVAYAVLFLASAGAEFTTGTIIDVNGASYLRS